MTTSIPPGGSSGCRASKREVDISVATRLLLAAYFLEAGLVLLIAPWSPFWDRNVFAGMSPAIDALLASSYTRGAVSGVGLITLAAGLAELAGAFGSRGSEPLASPPTISSDR